MTIHINKVLKCEFTEEIHLDVEVGKFLFLHEYLDPPLHGIELFFEVSIEGGKLKKGAHPEMEADFQIITQTGFKPFEEIKQIPNLRLHHVIQNITSFESLLNQTGYFKFH
tara:strand:+ start:52733 stop:53065 length:333 start_codon:yes stop_codon:yes gene_type:complete